MGEWLVMDRLSEYGCSPSLESRQNDVDILLRGGEGVEVKSATWDSRLGGVYIFDRVKPEKLDYLICVKFPNDYSAAEYFVFDKDDVESLPPRNKSAFNNPDKSDNQRFLRILDNPEETSREDMKSINRRLAEFRDSWHKLPNPE